MKLETVIGLEIHVQLKTKSKMFCGCSNEGENQPPNTTICEVCLGHPGVLPVPNKQAIEWAIKAALALNCQVTESNYFERKNYFYPDLPKGYQISQFVKPIGEHGWLEIVSTKQRTRASQNNPIAGQARYWAGANEKAKQRENNQIKIAISRLHLEEDAAKNIHQNKDILVDFNRGGTPLMEIVTAPDISSPQEVRVFLQELRLIMRYLGVSDADMEKGHLRVDANISLREIVDNNVLHSDKDEALNPKTEIKNLNSFKAVERALEYEVIRQTKLWEQKKQPIEQATRGWDEKSQTTVEQRSKEESEDYRYFPEPDIPTLKIKSQKSKVKTGEELIDLEKIKEELPELPQARRVRFAEVYGINPVDVRTLVEDVDLANYFEAVVKQARALLEIGRKTDEQKLSKLVSNWLINKLGALVIAYNQFWADNKISPDNFVQFIDLLTQGKISSKIGQVVLRKMYETGQDPASIVAEGELEQVGDEREILAVVKTVIKAHPEEVASFKAGKEALLQFFVGQVMKESQGKADPELTSKLLKQEFLKQ